jgi:hypothetical protein
MARPEWRDRAKERFWRRVLRRWQRSGQRVRDFCAAESLSEPSFFAWRRELARRDQEAADIVPRFVPVQVRSEVEPMTASPAVTSVSPAVIELVLTNGRVLRVPAGFDPALLRQLLSVAEESPPC